jgi:hypothetical protein
MIAARRGQQKWRYLDGSALRKNRDLLWTFFPELDRSVKLPKNTVEILNTTAEERGADQSATAQESRSGGKGEPQPESNARPE